MEVIQSGTTVERIVRTLLVTGLTVGFSVAFLYDGYIGYPRENAANLMKSLGLEAADRPQINPKVTSNESHRIIRASKDGGVAWPVRTFGEPSLTHETFAYFVGRGGHLRAKMVGESFSSPAWREAGHTESDLIWQVWLGFTLGAVGVILSAQFIRVATTRVVLSADGLKVRGRALIPFSAITRLDAEQFEETGRLDIEYSMNDREGRVRLESYVVKRLGEIRQALQSRLDPSPTKDGSSKGEAPILDEVSASK